MVPWICSFMLFFYFNINLVPPFCDSYITLFYIPCFLFFIFNISISETQYNTNYFTDLYLKLCRKMVTLFLLLAKRRYLISEPCFFLSTFHFWFLFPVSYIVQENSHFITRISRNSLNHDFDHKQVAGTNAWCQKCFGEFSVLIIIILKFF